MSGGCSQLLVRARVGVHISEAPHGFLGHNESPQVTGAEPASHGSLIPGRDLEVLCAWQKTEEQPGGQQGG